MIEELKKRLSDYQFITTELENNAGWQKFIEILAVDVKNLDDSWHMIKKTEEDKWVDYRVTKMAYKTLIDSMELMKSECIRLQSEIERIENPED